MKTHNSRSSGQFGRIILLTFFLLSISCFFGQIARSQFPGAHGVTLDFQRPVPSSNSDLVISQEKETYSSPDAPEKYSRPSSPVFAMGPTSEQYQAYRDITYDLMSINAENISYELDINSLKGGNLINSTTGEVTYTHSWTGTTVITATVTNGEGYSSSSCHTVVVHPLPVADAGDTKKMHAGETLVISGARAENGVLRWTHNGSGKLADSASLTPKYTASEADTGKTVRLTLTVTSNYRECGEEFAASGCDILVQPGH